MSVDLSPSKGFLAKFSGKKKDKKGKFASAHKKSGKSAGKGLMAFLAGKKKPMVDDTDDDEM